MSVLDVVVSDNLPGDDVTCERLQLLYAETGNTESRQMCRQFYVIKWTKIDMFLKQGRDFAVARGIFCVLTVVNAENWPIDKRWQKHFKIHTAKMDLVFFLLPPLPLIWTHMDGYCYYGRVPVANIIAGVQQTTRADTFDEPCTAFK